MGNGATKPKFGYNVLKVQPGSPGDMAGLCAFFDFIVKADTTILDKDNDDLTKILQNHLDREVPLTVYNSKHDTLRTVKIIPSSNWGGKGLLGVSIRFCSIQGAIDFVWHVLEVYANSPAEAAGLQAYKDYIVGTPDIVFNDSEDFYSLIEANLDKPVQLYIYNLDTDGIRLATLVPHKGWGGNGSLGCGVGYGYLHRIPHKRETALQIFTGTRSGSSLAPQPDLEGAPEENSNAPIVSSAISQPPRSVPLIPVTHPIILSPLPSTTTMPPSVPLQTSLFPSSPFITPVSSGRSPSTPPTSFTAPRTSPVTTPPTSLNSASISPSTPFSSLPPSSADTTTPVPSTRTTPTSPVIATPYSFSPATTTTKTPTTPMTPLSSHYPTPSYPPSSPYGTTPLTAPTTPATPTTTTTTPVTFAQQPTVTYAPYSPFGSAAPIQTAAPVQPLASPLVASPVPTTSVSSLTEGFTNISLDDPHKS